MYFSGIGNVSSFVHCDDDSRREQRVVHLGQVVVQKRFLMYPLYSVYHAAIQNRSKAWFWDSEMSRADWERGSLQSCSLFQDRKILLRLTMNLLCSVNPEFWPTTDSQSWITSEGISLADNRA